MSQNKEKVMCELFEKLEPVLGLYSPEIILNTLTIIICGIVLCEDSTEEEFLSSMKQFYQLYKD
jgi:hypothetical protein